MDYNLLYIDINYILARPMSRISSWRELGKQMYTVNTSEKTQNKTNNCFLTGH